MVALTKKIVNTSNALYNEKGAKKLDTNRVLYDYSFFKIIIFKNRDMHGIKINTTCKHHTHTHTHK